MKYWDSSALVPIVVKEAPSRRLLKLLADDLVVVTWWGSEVECASAIARLERDNKMTNAAVAEAFKRLDQLQKGWHQVQPSASLKPAAKTLLRLHDLRAADALQLAAAIAASEQQPHTLDFVCLDARLAQAAERQGFSVIRA